MSERDLMQGAWNSGYAAAKKESEQALRRAEKERENVSRTVNVLGGETTKSGVSISYVYTDELKAIETAFKRLLGRADVAEERNRVAPKRYELYAHQLAYENGWKDAVSSTEEGENRLRAALTAAESELFATVVEAQERNRELERTIARLREALRANAILLANAAHDIANHSYEEAHTAVSVAEQRARDSLTALTALTAIEEHSHDAD